MRARGVWLLAGVLCTGCHLFGVPGLGNGPTPAEQAWEQGQESMRRGDPQGAVGYYRQSLASDPGSTRAYLSSAAAHLEGGDEAAACEELGHYVTAHPEQLALRTQFAELLLRLRRADEARGEFERLVADAQEHGGADAECLIHCQRRLMEIAEAGDDDYGEHLHRGIGLYWLARQRANVPDPEDTLPVEGLLCKAAAELTLAHQEKPEMARPCWYLYEVWSRLDQRQPALQNLHAADAAFPLLDLTPAEHRGLDLAWQQIHSQTRKKS